MLIERLNVRHYKVGYDVRTERVTEGDDSPVIVRSAYTPEGYYIGTSKFAHNLMVKRGIKPELVNPKDQVCSIGFCEKEQRWYGWSHRAIRGFAIGDVVNAGDCCASSGWTDEYLEDHPEADISLPIGFKAKVLGDAQRMAIAFADSVG